MVKKKKKVTAKKSVFPDEFQSIGWIKKAVGEALIAMHWLTGYRKISISLRVTGSGAATKWNFGDKAK